MHEKINKRLIGIREVESSELPIAWGIFLKNYKSYIKRYPESSPERMSHRDFDEMFHGRDIKFFFATYDSSIFGVYYVVNRENNRKNLATLWMIPEFEYSGIVSTVISLFEQQYDKAESLSIGPCQLKVSDIDECQRDGWKVLSKLEWMFHGVAVVHMEKVPISAL